MQYVLLIAPRAFELEDLGRAAPDVLLVERHGGRDRFVFCGITPHQDVGLQPLGAEASDWADDPEQMVRIEAMGPSREIYAVHFKDVERLKTVLCKVADSAEFIVDDDEDLFVRGDEFCERCRAKPGENGWWLGGHYA